MKQLSEPAGKTPLARSASRRGISLLEVLIAIMVLSIGLLGLASLIPVGKFEVAQAMIVDRGATLGRLAARDLQIRGLLRPEMCLFLNPSAPASQAPIAYSTIPLTWLTNQSTPPLIMMPLCIDPLMIGHPQNLTLSSTPHATFPYVTPNVPVMPGAPPIARCTISSYDAPVAQTTAIPAGASGWPFSNPGATGLFRMDYRQAERMFRSSDDLTFALPDLDSQRPDQVFQYQSSPIQPVQRQFQGDFSWLVTVSPALSDFLVMGPKAGAPSTSVSWLGTQIPRTFNISIVVFHKRVPIVDTSLDVSGSVPAERIVYADVLGTGFGGGDIILRVKGLTQVQATNLLAVKAQQWIMLVGTMNNNSDLVKNRVVLAWYRVIKVGDQVEDLLGNGSNWGRRVTLAGPDWLVANPLAPTQQMYLDVSSDALPVYGNVSTVHAGIFDGAIAVYDRTVTLDGFSLWQQ
jgi:hypothetical protein